MLTDFEQDLLSNYYDPQYHGMDVRAQFKDADDKLQKATSLNQAFAIIAWTIEGMNDSHTFFIPPPRPYRLDYGWNMDMIGDQCYVTSVKPGSDAEKKGLKAGDLVRTVDGVAPGRDTLWKIDYLFKLLRPQPGLEVVVQEVDGQERTLVLAAEMHEGKVIVDYGTEDFWNDVREAQSARWFMRRRSREFGNDLIIWKLPTFLFDPKGVDDIIGQARNFRAMILDLRGNPGGFTETLTRMIGSVISHDVKVGDLRMRKQTKPMLAKTRGDKVYSGKLIVLIDSQSASGSELFARVMQIEKRATVLGDISSGSVMESQIYPHVNGMPGFDKMIFFASSVSQADIIMVDGKSLEHAGVVPDERILPTATDLTNERDPVLARAAELANVKLSPEDAGKLFPTEWRMN
ncbi:MAG: S41 family peptidase [Candidatus Acidiferrales bacterium]